MAHFLRRAEIRDVLAWLRLLADPADSAAAVRALTRPPVELHSVDAARVTQLARRRKLEVPAAVAAACKGPQLSPEGRERAQAFLKLHRAAAAAFEEMRPDLFVERLIERLGLRRRLVFATREGEAERLAAIAGLSDLAATYVRHRPRATARELARYLAATAESAPDRAGRAAAALPQLTLDDHLRALDAGGGTAGEAAGRLAAALGNGRGGEPSLGALLPRRGEGLMLSVSDIETYRICPLKYKFARVFRIPQETTVNQRLGILVHQVLERFHTAGGGPREQLAGLLEEGWRRSGLGDTDEARRLHEKTARALDRYWELDRERTSEPVWFERGFSFKLGPHSLRGRVDRVDRLPDGGHELIDYKTGRPKSEAELRDDVQLTLYRMGAREAWQLETSAHSYYHVLDNEKVPVAHSDADLERVRTTVEETAAGIMRQEFEPRPSPEICPHCDYRIVCPAAEVGRG